MTAYRSLIITAGATGGASVTIPVHGSHDLTQTYEDLQAQTIYRHLDGSATLRRSWRGKVRSEISARGVIPSALQELLLYATGPVIVDCVGHRSLQSATGADIPVPKARRRDLTLPTITGGTATGATCYVRAWDGDRYLSVTGTVTSGASGSAYDTFDVSLASGEEHDWYEMVWLPKLTGYATLTSEEYQQNGGWGWTLTIEQT
jgi:hypothetical protein